MSILKVLVDKGIEEIKQASDLFYQQKINAGYLVLNNIILLLSDFIHEVEKGSQDGLIFNINKLNEILNASMHAMEQKDVILLSDILNYELQELLLEYKEMLL